MNLRKVTAICLFGLYFVTVVMALRYVFFNQKAENQVKRENVVENLLKQESRFPVSLTANGDGKIYLQLGDNIVSGIQIRMVIPYDANLLGVKAIPVATGMKFILNKTQVSNNKKEIFIDLAAVSSSGYSSGNQIVFANLENDGTKLLGANLTFDRNQTKVIPLNGNKVLSITYIE